MSDLIFEQSQSALYYSNDGKLRLVVKNPGANESYSLRFHINEDDYEVVFTTYDRVKADAYIAGYDLAQAAA